MGRKHGQQASERRPLPSLPPPAIAPPKAAPASPTHQGWSPCFSSGGHAAVSMMVRLPRRELLAARATAARLLLRPPPPPAGTDRLAPLDCTAGPFVMALDTRSQAAKSQPLSAAL